MLGLEIIVQCELDRIGVLKTVGSCQCFQSFQFWPLILIPWCSGYHTSNKIWHIHSIKSELFEGSKTAHNIPEVFHYVSLWWWSHLEIKLKGVVWWKKGTFNFQRIEFLMYFYIWKIFIILFSIKTCSSYMLTQIHGVPWHFLSLFHKTYHCRH